MKRTAAWLLLICLLWLPSLAPSAKTPGVQVKEDSAVSPYTAALLRYTITSELPAFASLEILADRTVLVHPNDELVGMTESRMLDRIEEEPALMISSYGSMKMANLRLDGAFGNETPEQKDKRETYNGLRYLRNQAALELRDGIGKGTLSAYLKTLKAAGAFKERLKAECADTDQPLTLRERYDYLNTENYLIDDSFTISANMPAEKLLGAAPNGTSATVTICLSSKKYAPRVYLLQFADDGSRSVLRAEEQGSDLYRFERPLSALTGHYLVLVSAAEAKDPKCLTHWVLIVFWLVLVILLARIPFRHNWPRVLLTALGVLISSVVSAYAILIPGCFTDAYVTLFGLFVAYIVVRLKWKPGKDYLI